MNPDEEILFRVAKARGETMMMGETCCEVMAMYHKTLFLSASGRPVDLSSRGPHPGGQFIGRPPSTCT